MADQNLTLFTVPVTGAAPAGSVLVVEVFTPEGQTAGNSFFIGSNPDGETGPSYLAAADCGVTEPTPTAAIGFPDMHIVMNVTGDTEATGCSFPTDVPWLSETPTAGTNAPATSTPVQVSFDFDRPGARHLHGQPVHHQQRPRPRPRQRDRAGAGAGHADGAGYARHHRGQDRGHGARRLRGHQQHHGADGDHGVLLLHRDQHRRRDPQLAHPGGRQAGHDLHELRLRPDPGQQRQHGRRPACRSLR